MTDIREIVAKAAYVAHHNNGPTEESLEPPNMGRGGFKTEVIVWRAVTEAALQAIEQAGYAIVPVETILRLCDEAEEYDVYSTLPADTRAMLTAAKEGK